MTYILITLIGASFIFEYQLLKKINKVKKENQKLQTALSALGRDANNFQAGISRDLYSQKKELEISINQLRGRIYKSVDVVRRDIISSLPTKIRKVIGHIEFSSRA